MHSVNEYIYSQMRGKDSKKNTAVRKLLISILSCIAKYKDYKCDYLL